MRIAPFPFVLPEDLRRYNAGGLEFEFMDGLWLPEGTRGRALLHEGTTGYEVSFRHMHGAISNVEVEQRGYPDYWNKVIADAERNIARATLTENERLAANVLVGLSQEGRLESFYTDMRG